jgi:hypothetical protein
MSTTWLRRPWEGLLAALNFDDDSVEQPSLRYDLQPQILYADAQELVESPGPIGFAGEFTPATNAARFSVVEIQALRGELVLQSVIASAAVNWQFRHLADDADPITNDLATPVAAVWVPRGTRVAATIFAAAPFQLIRTGTSAIVNYGAATAVYNNTIPMSSGFDLKRSLRIPQGMSLVAQHATLNTAFTLDVWGSWVPNNRSNVGLPPRA